MTGPEAQRLLEERIRSRSAHVVVIGQGHIGLQVALRATACGFPTTGVELDPARIVSVRTGVVSEPQVNAETIADASAHGYRIVDRIDAAGDFDVAIVAVPTPLRGEVPDLRDVEAAAVTLADVLRRGVLVVLESTTYPGTTESVLTPLLERSGLRAGDDFYVAYSPERIDAGNTQYSLANTPKLVSGIDAVSAHVAGLFYQALVRTVVPVERCAEAELAKLFENSFRVVNIALVNEFAALTHRLGLDVRSVLDAAGTKPFGFTPFLPGPGVGGHCLPSDSGYLAWFIRSQLDTGFELVELARRINDRRPTEVVERATSLLTRTGRSVAGSSVLLLGLAYKAATADTRDSPSLSVASQLHDRGAVVSYCDPHVPMSEGVAMAGPRVPFCASVLAAADLVIVLVDHPAFIPDVVAQYAQLVLDTRGVMRSSTFCGEVL